MKQTPEFDNEVVPLSERDKPIFSANQLSITPPAHPSKSYETFVKAVLQR